MPFFELLVVSLGTAVAKATLKLWLRNADPAQDVSMSMVDIAARVTPDLIERRKTVRQFERIAESIAEKLEPFLNVEYGGITDNDREAAILAVADTINGADLLDVLFEADLDPARLERQFRTSAARRRRDLSSAGERLFDAALHEACQYITEIATTLPGFELQATRELLRSEDRIVDLARQVLERLPVRFWGEQVFETQYRRHVARKLDRLELFGLKGSGLSQRYALSVAYITLTGTPPSRMAAGPAAPTYMRVDKVLAQSRRVLVKGQAGSGKSTLLQWLAVRSSRRDFPAALADWNDTIPFFLQLRYFSDGPPRPEAFLDRVAPHLAGVMPAEWAHQQLQNGRALVLIDGIDELAPAARSAVREWLTDLTEMFPEARYVVTSRQAAVSEGWLRAEHFAESELQPMSRVDINAFINHWHAAMNAGSPHPESRLRLQQLSVRLQTVVNENQHLRRLASNPLLCAIICALHREQMEDLPRQRMELYRVALATLLQHRDAARRVPRAESPDLTLSETYLLLQDLAWWLIINEKNDAGTDEVVARLEKKLSTMPRLTGTAAQVYDHLLVRSGALREPVTGRVDFVHRTFQEFLGAEEAVRNNDIGVLLHNAHLDQWHEVVVLAAGHANRPQLEELLHGLIERGHRHPRYRHRLHLLAVACLETCAEQPPKHQEELRRCVESLVPPSTMADAADLASAGELAIPPLEQRARAIVQGERSSDPAKTAAACIRTLALVGGEAALTALRHFAGDSRVGVVRELVRAWGYFDPEEFAVQVMARSPLEQGDLELRDPTLLRAAHHLPRLESLHCQFSARVTELGFLEGIRRIATLDLSYSRISDLQPLGSLGTPETLRWLSVAGCELLSDVSPLVRLTGLRIVHLSNCPALADLSPIASLGWLQHLFLRSCECRDLRPLARLQRLQTLDLSGSGSVEDLSWLREMTGLEHLELAGCPQVRDLSPLAGLTRLTELDLSGCNHLADLSELSSLAALLQLDLSGCAGLTDLAGLSGARSLETLSVAGCAGVTDLRPLQGLPGLRHLDLAACDGLTDLAPLASLHGLRSLSLRGCRGVGDLTPLGALGNLSALNLRGCPEVRDVAPVADLPSLSVLDVREAGRGLDVDGLERPGRKVLRSTGRGQGPVDVENGSAGVTQENDVSDICPRCGALVYSRKRQCGRCGAPRWVEDLPVGRRVAM